MILTVTVLQRQSIGASFVTGVILSVRSLITRVEVITTREIKQGIWKSHLTSKKLRHVNKILPFSYQIILLYLNLITQKNLRPFTF